ncbi:DUF1080 domain-containing protein [Hymenobacter sp. ASUV-10]|uniref:DUF1080 domain-containing protein n=1 Tax=Hymenobacter aranciens TaxID=3063996 RepID=A0ABT9BCC8_9BACT|nr:DUF1080 domain-containing protein [Hymenobacter sp. ASUV-10]MDO7875852.1 DUF1080 domain-containing protein [Hymenobacter sp. ASUV-10]
MKQLLLTATLSVAALSTVCAQQTGKPEDTEVYTPVPPVVVPAATASAPPADAIILFNGKDLSQWVMTDDRNTPAKWKVAKGAFTVDKSTGNIETRRSFGSYQLHLEWRIPVNINGTGQGRGNSGVFLASTGKGDLGYELQILDSYQNSTYSNGMAGSIYKQHVPLANPTRRPGEWQTYDVVWLAPTFRPDGSLAAPARVTVLFNGVVVQNAAELAGPTQYIGQPSYQAHGPAPIKLQAHGDKSEPVSFRNIWVRPL